ncbi:nicotinic acid mononucleotide adenylyltransferase [Candidatus Poribacteria bacterium]|nr:MAG: nicotinic acid mononucleotide adenylyltransferase [Candidatus Poribacteria bacterium]
MKIAVMGGTFNPIHYAHLISAEQVREGLNYDKILFVPAARPPHKSQPDMVSAEHRYQMVKLATAQNPYFDVSRIELDRNGPSYTIQTIKVLRQTLKEITDLAWIIGADSLIEYKIWKDFDDVLKLCTLVVTTRPNYDLEQVPLEIRNQITIFRITGSDISATEIRNRIRKKLSVRYLIPEVVVNYINEHHLFQDH